MGEIAGERSRVGVTERRRLTRVHDTSLPAAASSRERTRRGSAVLVDGSILLFVPLLFPFVAGAGQSDPGRGALMAFGLLAFVLLRRFTAVFAHLRPAFELATLPVVTATAAAVTLVLWRTPAVGINTALTDAIRPWLVTTAFLVLVRLVLASTASSVRRLNVTKAVDRVLKRTFDVVFAGAILILTAPVALVVALAIWLDDRGPILYRCERFGAHGRKLELLKFRKMRDDAGGPRLTSTNDDRFTRVGRFLARSKLDELPQLWNVLRGDMSLVGPRPEDLEFVAAYADEFAEIARVRPGVTGLCQLAFAKEAEIIGEEDRVRTYTERYLPQKLKIDLLYVEQRSLMFDLTILFWTVLVLVRKDVAVHRETGELSLRRRRQLAESAPRAA